jgi:RNA polymerase sigma-70 factor (ECF subfamily)
MPRPGHPGPDANDGVDALTRPLDPDEVYRRFAPAVFGYVRAQAATEPEDLAAEVFYQVVRDLGRFEGDDVALRRWIFTIAHHRLVDHHRRRRRSPVSVSWDAALHGRVAAPAADQFDDRQLVDALKVLTRAQRDVVVLRFIADLSIADVARLLHRRRGAVKALQNRALAHLAELLSAGGVLPAVRPRRSGELDRQWAGNAAGGP